MGSVVDRGHLLLSGVVRLGDVVIDGTLGTGRDTLFLARLVGPDGLVIGFDVQEIAITLTQKRLEEEGALDRTELLLAGHETMRKAVPIVLAERGREGDPIAAVTFNFGYLPKGDKSIMTKAGTSLEAVRAAYELVRPGGLVVNVLYPCHVGGDDERDVILEWANQLSGEEAKLERFVPKGTINTPPELLAIRKLKAVR